MTVFEPKTELPRRLELSVIDLGTYMFSNRYAESRPILRMMRASAHPNYQDLLHKRINHFPSSSIDQPSLSKRY
jgi:hypothetical protein